MSTAKKAEELAFNRRYSRFKLQIFFARRSAITHYGQERYGCTVAQIKFKRVTTFWLDREKGLQDCLDRIALCDRLYNGYQTALIYDRLKILTKADGTRERGREVMKFVMGNLVESDESFFATDAEKRIRYQVVYGDNNIWNIKPVEAIAKEPALQNKADPSPPVPIPSARQSSLRYQEPDPSKIDFKKEITNALSQQSPKQ